jgi:arylsulfatase
VALAEVLAVSPGSTVSRAWAVQPRPHLLHTPAARFAWLAAVIALAAPGAHAPAAAAPVADAPGSPRPNVLLILADDLGYSDLGCYGGEIKTPNLDRLAADGLRFTQFYNCARCCPSRACLLTGLYPHQAGVGHMTEDAGRPGYRGHLNDRCVTLAEVLKSAGYRTYLSGKWHLGQPGPLRRGFDECYMMEGGFRTFWNPAAFRRLPADRPKREYPPGQFYSTDALTDYALDFLTDARKLGRPFFLYLAYNAPHFPLHAPKEEIAKYAELYTKGWDVIRAGRYERMGKLGLLGPGWPLTPRSEYWHPFKNEHGTNPAWDTIPADRRADLARRMAIYAGMVDRLDQNVGRVVDDLRKNGQLDNTLILFLSDNGACAEWDPWGFDGQSGPNNVLHKGADLEAMGGPDSYLSYGSGWANASNTPWRLYKHYAHEGGVSTPLIAHWPAGMKRTGAIDHRPGHLIDLMATFVEVAGATYPGRLRDHDILPAEGRSLLPALRGEPDRPRTLFWEHEGNRAVRDGQWKLVGLHGRPWELYDIEADRSELTDLAARHPDRVRDLAARYDAWAKRCDVLPWPVADKRGGGR